MVLRGFRVKSCAVLCVLTAMMSGGAHKALGWYIIRV